MKKIAFFFFLLSACFSGISFAADTPDYYLPDIKYTRRCPAGQYKADMVGFPNTPPFSWTHPIVDSGGNSRFLMNGLGVDLANLVIDRIGDIERSAHATYRFDAARRHLSRNEADLLVSTYYIRDDMKNVDYIYPAYLSNPIMIMTMRDKPLTKAEDLLDKKGGISKSEEFTDSLKSLYPNLSLTEVKDYKTALLALQSGEFDYILTGLYTSEAETRRFRVDGAVAVSGPINYLKIFMAISEKSCLAEFKNIFQESFDKWTVPGDSTIRKLLFENVEKYVKQKRAGRPLFSPKKRGRAAELLGEAPEAGQKPLF